MIPQEKIIRAGIDEYLRTENDARMTDDETLAAKDAIRGVMVRAGCYAEFCDRLNGPEKNMQERG